jgi:DeoR/GlpR family transcriptional regulator of sugar metabolism
MGTRRKDYVRQADILRAIKMHEPVTGPQLAKMFKRTRQAIHMRLRMMERRGLIERVVAEPEAPIVPVRYRCSFKLREMEQMLQKQAESD